MKKRIVSIGLALCVMFIMLPVSVFAAEIVDNGMCGDNVSWVLDNEGTLFISGSGVMYDWDLNAGDAPWYDYREQVVSINISEGITSIGEAAFSSFTNLESVSIPNSVKYIETFAFYRCEKLGYIYLPSSVTDIGNYVFAYCDNLMEIEVSDDNNSFCSIDGVLYDNSKTTLITWPCGKGNGSIYNGVSTIAENAMYGCDKITEIVIPASVTLIERYGIRSCANLRNITIEKDPVFGHLALTDCENLENFYVNSDSTLYCSEDGVLFSKDKTTLVRCPAAKRSISISDKITELSNQAFDECQLLTEIQIPGSVQKIGEQAFSGCRSLSKLVIPSGIKEISGFIFSNSTSLSTVYIPSSVSSIGQWAFFSCRSIKHVLFEGTKDQWDTIEKDDIELSEDVVITYNYILGDEYHVYDNDTDDHCNICDNLRIECEVNETVNVEITTSSSYDFVLKGEGAKYVNAQKVSISFIFSDNERKCVTEYALTFSQPGKYELLFWDENYYKVYPFTAEIKAHEHIYSTETIDPSCAETGYTTYTCACGDSYISGEVPALGHDEVLHEAVSVTCTTDGKTEGISCKRCGAVLQAQEIIPAPGHTWDEGVVTQDPSKKEAGIRTFTCTVCGETKTEEIPYIPPELHVDRIYGAGRVETGIEVADQLKAVLGV